MVQTLNLSWTPKLAYAVGLITTDGSLSRDKRHIDLTSSDKQLLQAANSCLGLNNRITDKSRSTSATKSYYHIQFSNVALYRWLTKIGLRPNKTYSLGKLNIPKKYFRDFLRGHLDGDGSIVTYNDRYASYKGKTYSYQRLYLTFYASQEKHLRWIRSTIKGVIGKDGSLLGWKNKHDTSRMALWKLRYAKNDSLKILRWIYYKPHLPCLLRKRRIAIRWLQS